MAEEKKGEQPKYKGNGVAVWENTDKNGKTYLRIQILDSVYVNAWLNEPKKE